jgi:hypothetical protein
MSRPHDGPRRRAEARNGAVIRGLAAVTLLLAGCSAPPPTVDRITLVNPTDYDLHVHVTGREQGIWLPVAIVEARSEDVAQDVIDQGDRWTFRFLYTGESLEETSLTRAELERNGWRVVIPAELGERLRELGEPPSD